MGYYESLPASFGSQVFSTTSGASLSSFNFAASADPGRFSGNFGTDSGALDLPGLGGPGALSTGAAWTFITAPEDVSWSLSNQATRVDMFGTNNPPVVAGSRGMRDLKLGNSLVEGFVRNVSVEDKVAALEQLLAYTLNTSDGFVNVPVYQVKANDKAYGNGYYIIRDVNVKETMRDLKGNATRAYVDIDLMEVPAYQVNTGRDIASKPAAAAKALALPDPNATNAQQQAAANSSATGRANQGVGTTTAASGVKAAGAGKQPAPAVAPRTGQNRFAPLPIR